MTCVLPMKTRKKNEIFPSIIPYIRHNYLNFRLLSKGWGFKSYFSPKINGVCIFNRI